METVQPKSVFRSWPAILCISVFLAVTVLAGAGGLAEAVAKAVAEPVTEQKLFATPDEAMKTFIDAVKAKDRTSLDLIFGPAAKDLLSGDEVQDAAELEDLAMHLGEKSSLVKEGDSKFTLHIGNDNWPFPIPIVQSNNQWRFDTEAGREEILNRRVGENELIAILVCRSYVKAQREFAIKDWDNDGIVSYAQKLRSDKDKKNGLYWKAKPGEEVSPFGELIAKARMEGYRKQKAAFKDEPTPFHGYYFKILTEQGKHAPGGKYNYIINGNMVGGFALAAFPSNWGKSGVMTFIVNQQGKVFQKNLGPDTLKMTQKMKKYNPDKTWTPVKD